MQKNKSTYSPLLKCHFCSYSIKSEIELTLYIPQNHCTDMRGAITFASKIIPAVEKINVFSDNKPDIEYKSVDGKWEAFNTRVYVPTAKDYLKQFTKPKSTIRAVPASEYFPAIKDWLKTRDDKS